MNFQFFLCSGATLLSGAISARADVPALTARNIPNPTGVHFSPSFKRNPFRFMWYYRTEVKNNSRRPLRVVRFQAYRFIRGRWIAGNITGRPLTSRDFSRWYSDGAPVRNGWIQPGQTAVCDPNWHGSNTPTAPRGKWSFMAVDAQGRVYPASAEIVSLPVKVNSRSLQL